MKSPLLKSLFFVAIIFALAISCKKENSTKYSTSESYFQVQTQKWLNSIKYQMSDTILKLSLTKINELDYSSALKLESAIPTLKIFVVKTKWQNDKFSEYLSFAETKGVYWTIGYLRVSKNSLELEAKNLRSFFKSKRIDKDFKVGIYQLSKRHFSTFQGTENGGIKELIVSRLDKYSSQRYGASSSTNCIDWYLVTTYTFADGTQYVDEQYVGTTCNGNDCQVSDPNGQNLECVNPDQGGGNLLGFGNLDGMFDICNKSFKFEKLIDIDPSTNKGGWQVCGVRDIHMQVVNTTTGQTISLNLPTIYFGLPVIKQNGDFYSTNTAASISSAAVEYAERKVMDYYHAAGGIVDAPALSLYYRQKINEFMVSNGGKATLEPGTYNSPVPVANAIYSGILGFNCL